MKEVTTMRKLRYAVVFRTWHSKTVKFTDEYNARLFARYRSRLNGTAVVVHIDDNNNMKKVTTFMYGEETSGK
jgi:hypothetical protein